MVSTPGLSRPSTCLLGPGSFSLVIITSARGKAEEMKGDEIQMSPFCHLSVARLQVCKGEEAVVLLWFHFSLLFLSPRLPGNIEWAV